MAKVPLSFLPATDIGGGGFLLENWWEEINESANWQDGIFFALCAAYALVSAVALIQLIRIEVRVPEYGWTTQKVFHLMNFIVNGVRAIVFGFHVQVFNLHPRVLVLGILDLPGLLFFSTYILLVLFWAEIYHQARSLPTDKLRIVFITVNAIVYAIQACIWTYIWINDNSVVEFIGKIFIAVVSFVAALGFLVYGGRLFFMLRRFPIESKGRRKKLHEFLIVVGWFCDGHMLHLFSCEMLCGGSICFRFRCIARCIGPSSSKLDLLHARRDPSISSGALHFAEVATQENFGAISPYPLADAPYCYYNPFQLQWFQHQMLVSLSMRILKNSPDVFLEWLAIVAILFTCMISRGSLQQTASYIIRFLHGFCGLKVFLLIFSCSWLEECVLSMWRTLLLPIFNILGIISLVTVCISLPGMNVGLYKDFDVNKQHLVTIKQLLESKYGCIFVVWFVCCLSP